jgi:hypothetical protein
VDEDRACGHHQETALRLEEDPEVLRVLGALDLWVRAILDLQAQEVLDLLASCLGEAHEDWQLVEQAAVVAVAVERLVLVVAVAAEAVAEVEAVVAAVQLASAVVVEEVPGAWVVVAEALEASGPVAVEALEASFAEAQAQEALVAAVGAP